MEFEIIMFSNNKTLTETFVHGKNDAVNGDIMYNVKLSETCLHVYDIYFTSKKEIPKFRHLSMFHVIVYQKDGIQHGIHASARSLSRFSKTFARLRLVVRNSLGKKYNMFGDWQSKPCKVFLSETIFDSLQDIKISRYKIEIK